MRSRLPVKMLTRLSGVGGKAGMLIALLGVVTPILAGDVVRAINAGDEVSVVVWLAVAIAVVAVVDAGLNVLNRWLSSLIGEGLILDLRIAGDAAPTAVSRDPLATACAPPAPDDVPPVTTQR